MGTGFEEMEPIFGEVQPEEKSAKPFLFHVHGMRNDKSALAVHITDFHSDTWQALKSVQSLEDMRDMVGIGGSWSEFVAYVIASLKSEGVKLVLEGQSKYGGAAYAKLLAQKAKGMPRISISLSKLVDDAASEAMATISLELLKAFKTTRNLLTDEQDHCYKMTKSLAAEQDKSATIQRELDIFSKRQKCSDNSISDVTQDSDKKSTQTATSTKVSNRVVPAHRRAKVRGVSLVDTEDEQDQ